MSLVAYAASSDEYSGSECENEVQQTSEKAVLPTRFIQQNGHISDEDDDFTPVEASLEDISVPNVFTLSLPKPKNAKSDVAIAVDEITPAFGKLPMPKNTEIIVEEEDDEFLHKKATPMYNVEKPIPKGPVKITIPSLKEFSDVDKDMAGKMRNSKTKQNQSKSCGLLSILPTAKSEQNFAKSTKSEQTTITDTGDIPSLAQTARPAPTRPAFVPDTVKHRRSAYNTEGVDGIRASTNSSKPKKVGAMKTKLPLVNCSESEGSGDESGDFFSLHAAEKLPEVSSNEINALVAKKAAQIANATTNYLNTVSEKDAETVPVPQTSNSEELRLAQKRYHDQCLEADAVQALVGGNAKRRRKQAEQIQVMDISSDQVLPNRDEWMRNALAGSTAYQPTGVLVDEEPAAGTRRKHQITYLAHKAKANEAELQAMWAANRQTRRATQSKYGF